MKKLNTFIKAKVDLEEAAIKKIPSMFNEKA
jgi:hypothetical protein